MPFAPVNNTMLYYETFGTPTKGQAPVVLIHGSTQTGRSCWGMVAPLLARTHYVIVPDCRGHGQSLNPALSYSFRELAADTAGLIRALGFERAHLIGHSNGGNVVLVTLVEHPDVVETCIPMAANAWVSPDLPEKEPGLFDPERVARDDPAWMTEMIALHDPYQGAGCWRNLLKLTVDELISEPNYTPEILARVERPVLVIQGALDRVNAPYKHAQYIARHIPYAEQWIPTGIGHSVHIEILTTWVEHVEEFLARRGDWRRDAIHRLKQRVYPDDRLTIFDVSWESGGLTGRVLQADQRQAAGQVVGSPDLDGIRVLLNTDTPWALLNRPVEDVYKQPSILAERVSQVRLGEALRILEEGGDWSFVQVVHDGYLGWVHRASYHPCSQTQAAEFKAACTVQVRAGLAPAFGAPDDQRIAGRVPFGVRLPAGPVQDNRQALRLPDGRTWWIDADGLAPLSDPAANRQEQILALLDQFRQFAGVPYLWGGRTPFGFDCSGLAGVFWDFLGLSIPRDADLQFAVLPKAEGPLQPGDLLYFGEEEEVLPGHFEFQISHAAISLGGEEFIHANVAQWGVGFNSFDPASPLYRAWLKENYRGARRPGGSAWN